MSLLSFHRSFIHWRISEIHLTISCLMLKYYVEIPISSMYYLNVPPSIIFKYGASNLLFLRTSSESCIKAICVATSDWRSSESFDCCIVEVEVRDRGLWQEFVQYRLHSERFFEDTCLSGWSKQNNFERERLTHYSCIIRSFLAGLTPGIGQQLKRVLFYMPVFHPELTEIKPRKFMAYQEAFL